GSIGSRSASTLEPSVRPGADEGVNLLSLSPRLALLRPRVVMAVALAVIAVGLGFRVADAHAARGMEIAIQDDNVIVTQSYFKRDRTLKLARAFGATRLRINLEWAFTLPPGPRKARHRPHTVRYQFGIIDSAIDAAAKS